MGKKIILSLLFVALFAWIAGVSYYYVCKIRKNCETEVVNNIDSKVSNLDDSNTIEKNIVKPLNPIKDGDIIISQSPTDIIFAMGSSTIEEDGMSTKQFGSIKEYLIKNPNKNLKVTGLYLDNESEKIGLERSQTIISQVNFNDELDEARLISE